MAETEKASAIPLIPEIHIPLLSKRLVMFDVFATHFEARHNFSEESSKDMMWPKATYKCAALIRKVNLKKNKASQKESALSDERMILLFKLFALEMRFWGQRCLLTYKARFKNSKVAGRINVVTQQPDWHFYDCSHRFYS